jgi:anti-sigma B factor antagonist
MHENTQILVIDGVVTVRPHGELDMASAPALRAALETTSTMGVERIVVILSDVSFLDSTGLNALVHGWRIATDAGLTFTLSEPTPPVRRILDITNLDRLLDGT